MNVIVDASTARRGGGLTVASILLRYLAKWENIRWNVLASPELIQVLGSDTPGNLRLEGGLSRANSGLLRHSKRHVLLMRLIKKHHPDVVFFLGNYGLGTGRVPSVVLVQIDLTASAYARTWREKISWRLLQQMVKASTARARRTIAVSDHVAQQLIGAFGCSASSVTVIPLGGGLAVSGDSQARTPRSLHRKPYVFAVSGTQGYKNLQVLLDGVRIFNETAKEKLCLLVAGVDAKTATKRGYMTGDPWVSWLGYVGQERMGELYVNAEAYIHHSLAEAFPLPVLEAIRHGTPTIATDIPVIRSLYHDAVPTFLPTAADLAGKLKWLLHDEQRREQVLRKEQDAARRFNWESTATAIVQSLVDAAEAGGGL